MALSYKKSLAIDRFAFMILTRHIQSAI